MNDMNSLYSVSVIIPVHNTAPYLERCVESVRNQTLKNIEIILVENKSQDNSPVLCDEYARRDPRIKVLHLSIAGLSIARNAGLKIASAPYVGFIDSDDYISETMFQDLLDAISSSQAEMAYCNFCYEYEVHEAKRNIEKGVALYSQVCIFSYLFSRACGGYSGVDALRSDSYRTGH